MTLDKPETEFPEFTKDELEWMIFNAEQGHIESARLRVLVDRIKLIRRLKPELPEFTKDRLEQIIRNALRVLVDHIKLIRQLKTEFPEFTKDQLEQIIRNAEQGHIESARLLVDYTWLINRLRPSISEDSITVLSAYINRCADKFISGERGKKPRNRDKRYEAAFNLRVGKGSPKPKLSRKVADEIAYLIERESTPQRAAKGSYSKTPQERAAKTRRRNARTLSRNRRPQVTSKAEELLNDATGILIQVEKMKSDYCELLIMLAEHFDASEATKNAIREAFKPFDRKQWLESFFSARLK